MHADAREPSPEAETGVRELDPLRRALTQRLDLPEPSGRVVTHDEPGSEELGHSQPYAEVDHLPRHGPRPVPHAGPSLRVQSRGERTLRPPGVQRPRGEQHTSLRQRPQIGPGPHMFHDGSLADTGQEPPAPVDNPVRVRSRSGDSSRGSCPPPTAAAWAPTAPVADTRGPVCSRCGHASAAAAPPPRRRGRSPRA